MMDITSISHQICAFVPCEIKDATYAVLRHVPDPVLSKLSQKVPKSTQEAAESYSESRSQSKELSL